MANTITELPNGRIDLQDENGKSLLDQFGGPSYTREFAESAERMLNAFDRTDAQIAQINDGLRNAR